jgi:hypothetical protein
MSADYRLSAFDSVLGGLTLAYAIKPNLVISVGATYQDQQGIDRVVPTPAPLPPAFAILEDGEGGSGGPATASAADMTVLTGTIGITWKY